MTKVLIKNHSPAPQGFHELGPDGTPAYGDGGTFIAPGEMRLLDMPDADLKVHQAQQSKDLTIIVSPTDEQIAGAGVEADVARLQGRGGPATDLPDAADDGARAVGTLKPAGPVDPHIAGSQIGAADDFETKSDEQLRAFITDRDGKAPHHNLGRDKLLATARTASGSDEAVG